MFSRYLTTKILHLFKLKAFADDKLNVAEIMGFVFGMLEKIVGKGRKCLLLSFCFAFCSNILKAFLPKFVSMVCLFHRAYKLKVSHALWKGGLVNIRKKYRARSGCVDCADCADRSESIPFGIDQLSLKEKTSFWEEGKMSISDIGTFLHFFRARIAQSVG